MRIPEETVERIRQSADILEVINDFVSLKKRGSNYIACCPFHNEKTPSFNVNPSRQIYKCFGCGKAGDAVRFVMDIENIGYGEALRYLAKKYGVEIEEQEQTPEDLLRQNERESLLIVLNFAKTFFQETLLNSDEGKSIGLSYFRERGFSNPTIEAFELGYTLDQWDVLLKEGQRRGYSVELLEKAGLVLSKEGAEGKDRKIFDRFRGRVMFPIHNVSGRVIAFGARILKTDKNQPKYLNSPETTVYHKSQVLYGIYQAKQTIRQEDVCYLTEGYTDVISLHQAGIKNVVASSGTSLTTEQIRLISRFTPNVTILYDGDAAGIKAALRGLDMVLEEGLNLRLLLLPDGEDPDSYVHKVGAEAFKSYIQTHSQDFIDFKASRWLTEAGDNPLKRAEGISDVCASITKIPDPLKRQTLSQRVAQVFHVSEQSVISEINRLLRKQQDQHKKDYERQQQRSSPNKTSANSSNTLTAGEPSLDDINALLDGFSEEAPEMAGFGDTAPPVQSSANLSKAVRTPISYQEEECIRLLMNYGARELEPGISLCQYVLDELHEIEFQTAPYNVMLALFREAYSRGEILTANDFLNRKITDETDLQNRAIHLTTPRYEISEGWLKHEIFVPSEEEISILADAAYRNILRIKKMMAEKRMGELQQLMRESRNKSPEEADQILLEFMHYKRIDMQISGLLGTVISG
ncbi:MULTISPECIES: DNA primase [unclassified Spirosoma]|uniref:DNA primase n=1 Tax=unclassified Spirosoma TaxID=2621999 RepID=UPI00096418C2|nr:MULTISPECIES: DNA primase [unclassified Spirosoma]MBN8824786.1 DNA primase [Spirosoma sp.]OJW77061.1 MAG: DNA primase [Spirosoma sp. 48-14]